MAYSEALATRVRELVGARDGVTERRMFGGIAWMVHGNLAVGTFSDGLMVRLSPEDAERALAEPYVEPMRSGERVMRGFVRVDGAGLAEEAELAGWVDAGADHAASLPPK